MFDVCSTIAERVAATADDPRQLAAAEQLNARIRDGARLVWYPEAMAMGVGLLMVVFGGANCLVPLVVAGALVGAGGVFAIVFGFRRQQWQVRARQVGATVWRHGIR